MSSQETINEENKKDTLSFQDKLNENIKRATMEWWNSMSKSELLEYLGTQEQVTADYLRTMLANEGICIQFGATYNCNETTAETQI